MTVSRDIVACMAPLLSRPQALDDEKLGPGRESSSLADRIRALLNAEEIPAARRLLHSSLLEFPEDPELLRIQKALAPPRIQRRRVVDFDRSQEVAWLADHRDDPRYQGKWIALLGAEVIAAAESYQELVSTLRAIAPPRTPLVHRLG
jgi:hypothetical protein